MARLSKREFAEEKCGMQTKALSVYIGRGKVLVGPDGMIDTENPVNVIFMQERQIGGKNGHDEPTVTVESLVAEVAAAPVVTSPKTKVKPIREGKVRDNGFTEGVRKKLNLDTRMKEVEIEKKLRESQLLKNKQDRAAGKLIPTELVKGLFQNHFKAVVVSFKQGIDLMIVEIAKKKGMNINERAELKKQMIKIINGCIDDATKSSKKDIASLILEYSQTSSSE